ncbi:class I SAM-dependent methyltransferase [Haloglomus irregulare]|nr:methyltransferase domain-containing protein [Haloglomus irregulare]
MAVLSDVDRQKLDDGPDDRFYDEPRFVTHADETFQTRLTALYETVLDPGDRVFDAMGSWVSHLPETELGRVVGHGLNGAELDANDRYDEWFVQNLNEDRTLPLADESFDAVCCALSVQYLQYPEAVFAEFDRVLDTGGTLVVSFTNRMFPTKAVRAWRAASMTEREELVASYIRAGGMAVIDRVGEGGPGDPFHAVVGRSVP